MTSTRIYLDNAATSFPKPESVYDAVDRYQRNCGAPVGRSPYREALELQRTVDRCRERAAALLGASDARRIAFTFNGTDSLNAAIHGLLRPGDHVVTSTLEHNSVLRPLRDFEQFAQGRVTRLEPGTDGIIEPAAVRAAIGDETALVVVTHASNVTGTVQPIADIGEVAHARGVPLLVDAAQSAGHVSIDLATLPVDLLACSGHKGLMGPLGTGLLYVGESVEEKLRSIRQGGTGTQSEQHQQPANLPDMLESGNHNAPGLVGLEAALAYVAEIGVENLHLQSQELTAHFLEGVRALIGVTVHGCSQAGPARLGVVSVTVDGFDPQDLAVILDDSFRLQTRAGFHCAPLVHRHLGTAERGGTLRFSWGAFNTVEHIEAALAALREITHSA